MRTKSESILDWVDGAEKHAQFGAKLPMDRVWSLAMVRMASAPNLPLLDAIKGAVSDIIDLTAYGDPQWTVARGVLDGAEASVVAHLSVDLTDLTLRVKSS